jgi:hypothetical protein
MQSFPGTIASPDKENPPGKNPADRVFANRWISCLFVLNRLKKLYNYWAHRL